MGFKFGMVSLKRPKKNLNFPFKLTGDAHKLKVHFPSDKRHPNLDSIFPLVKSVTLVTRITRTTVISYSISDILAQYFVLKSLSVHWSPGWYSYITARNYKTKHDA